MTEGAHAVFEPKGYRASSEGRPLLRTLITEALSEVSALPRGWTSASRNGHSEAERQHSRVPSLSLKRSEEVPDVVVLRVVWPAPPGVPVSQKRLRRCTAIPVRWFSRFQQC